MESCLLSAVFSAFVTLSPPGQREIGQAMLVVKGVPVGGSAYGAMVNSDLVWVFLAGQRAQENTRESENDEGRLSDRV